jgi:Flp pilus assembly protein TadG
MTLEAKVLHLSGDDMSSRRRKMRQSGSTLLEFAVVVPCLMGLFFGTVGLGIMMGRYIQAEQMCRDIAHMYSDGVDFTQTTPQNIVVQKLGAGTGITATGGDGVVILSQVQTVYASDCTAAGVSPCTNQGLPVFTQRIVVGNSALRTSAYGTPSPGILDSSGNIAPTVFLSNSSPSVRTSGFEADLDAASVSAGGSGSAPIQPAGNTAYVVEVFIQYPDIGFLGWSTAGGAYTRFVFQ